MNKVLVIVMILCLSGCALFKKTTRTSLESKQELSRQTELNKLAVKTGQKETNVWTYWPDGSVYQWENRVEQLDEVGYGRLTVAEKAVAKQSRFLKESELLNVWIYLMIGAVVIATALIHLKFKK